MSEPNSEQYVRKAAERPEYCNMAGMQVVRKPADSFGDVDQFGLNTPALVAHSSNLLAYLVLQFRERYESALVPGR